MTKKEIIDAWAWIRQNNTSIPDDVLDLMKDAALEKMEDVEKESSGLTNSEIGSQHWFNTILSNHLHIGEFMVSRPPITTEQSTNWGNYLVVSSKELIDNFDKINNL